MVSMLVSCQGGSQNDLAQLTRDQIYAVGNGSEISGLDPHRVTGVPEDHVISTLFEGLIGEDPKGLGLLPGVAQSWRISKDGKVYTFEFQSNAKWSNGDAVVPEDFVFAWKRLLTRDLGAEYAYLLFHLKNGRAFYDGSLKDFAQVGVKALSPQSLEVTLEHPTPFFLEILKFYPTYPLHRGSIESFGGPLARDGKWTQPGNLVSNGPFQLAQWDLNKVLVAKANPHYWDASMVRLKEIRFYPIDSRQTEERMFRSGALHKTESLPLHKVEAYRSENSTYLRIEPYLGIFYYMLNTAQKPLNDKRVRQALSLAFDRKGFVEHLLKAGQKPADSFTPPGIGRYVPKTQLPYDVDRARQLLAEAGYPGGKGFPSIELLYNSGEEHRTMSEAVQQMWLKNLGIRVELVNQDWKVYLASRKQGKYTIARASWIGDYMDPGTFLELFVKDGGNNFTGWSNPRYSQWLKETEVEMKEERRNALFEKMEALLMDEVPVIPVYYYTRAYLLRPEVQGHDPQLLDRHPAKYLWLKPPAP